jgi:hypothetical protein
MRAVLSIGAFVYPLCVMNHGKLAPFEVYEDNNERARGKPLTEKSLSSKALCIQIILSGK